MHSLHKILVYIPDILFDSVACPKEDFIDRVRSYAEEQTSNGYMTVFDWRETASAGRWKSQYPVNVLFAKEDIEQFIQELIDVQKYQQQEIQYALDELSKKAGTDLKQIICEVEKVTSQHEITKTVDLMTTFYLSRIASLLYGVYTSQSCFYNISGETSRIYPQDIDAVKNNPEDWALVLFDYHY